MEYLLGIIFLFIGTAVLGYFLEWTGVIIGAIVIALCALSLRSLNSRNYGNSGGLGFAFLIVIPSFLISIGLILGGVIRLLLG